MELRYGFNDDYSMTGVAFDGLCGCEYVTSTKAALNVLQVKNPALVLREDVKKGVFDDVPDEEFNQILATINCIKNLWRYPDESTLRPEMNVLALLANAIELISRQDAALRRMDAEKSNSQNLKGDSRYGK